MRKNTSSRLRHRLTLQQEARSSDGAGGYTRSWTNVTDVWAEIVSFTGSSTGQSREVLFAGQLQSEITHRVLLRYRDGVTAGMRLVFESRAFNIITVVDTGEDRSTLELLVREGMAA